MVACCLASASRPMNWQPESVDASIRMIVSGSTSPRRIAVIGRGTAGSLAAAGVTNRLKGRDFELHHIHDPGIPSAEWVKGTGIAQPLRAVRREKVAALQHNLHRHRSHRIGSVRSAGPGRASGQLSANQGPKDAFGRHQFRKGTLLDQLARPHHVDAICLTQRGKAMCDDDPS